MGGNSKVDLIKNRLTEYTQVFIDFLGRFSTVIAVLAVSLIAFHQAQRIERFADKSSEVAGPRSEADAVRSVNAYTDLGVWTYYGLPVISYGRNGSPTAKELGPNPENFQAYTHYPPGPNLLNYALSLTCGVENYRCYRTYAVAFGLAVLITFIVTLYSVFGRGRGALILLLLLKPAMAFNMMHGIHYKGYAQSFLFLQLAILIHALFKKGKPSAWHYLGLFLITSLQGWFSFDYAFVVSFAALPIVVLIKGFHWDALKRLALPLVFVSGMGFTTSHLIHLGQVVAYYGGFQRAYEDLRNTAIHRATDGVRAKKLEAHRLSRVWQTGNFLNKNAKRGIHFGVSFYALIFIVLVIWKIQGRMANRNLHYSMLVALSISLMWVWVMTQHSAVHTQAIPRHLYLAYFVMVLSLFPLSQRTKAELN